MRTILYYENNRDGTVGGSYYSLLYLVSGLDRRRYHPIVIFGQDNPLIPAFQRAGVETCVIPRPAVFGCVHFLRRHGVDLVHINNSMNRNHSWIFAALLVGTPCISHERGIRSRYSLSSRVLSRFLKTIVCVSKAVEESVFSAGINHSRLETIHNGLDPTLMAINTDRATIRSRYGISQTDYVIGIVGNLKQWKGQEVVLRTMGLLTQELPNLYCLIVGAAGFGKEGFEQRLRDMVIDLGLQQQVIFTGYQENVADFVNAMDVLVHASVDPEPFGRVLLEGMALRKPVVASRAGGVPEIITDGESGVLYSPGDHSQLAEEILKLLKNPGQATALGEAGYKRLVDEFSIEKHVSQIQQLYETIFQKS